MFNMRIAVLGFILSLGSILLCTATDKFRIIGASVLTPWLPENKIKTKI